IRKLQSPGLWEKLRSAASPWRHEAQGSGRVEAGPTNPSSRVVVFAASPAEHSDGIHFRPGCSARLDQIQDQTAPRKERAACPIHSVPNRFCWARHHSSVIPDACIRYSAEYISIYAYVPPVLVHMMRDSSAPHR